MSMKQEDALREIPAEDYQHLLADLKSDFPNSIHAWSFLKTIERWTVVDPTLSVKILAINGDYRKKFIVFYITPPDLSDFQGTIYKWSHLLDDEEPIRKLLRTSKEIPWHNPKILITGLTPETTNAVLPVLGNLMEAGTWYYDSDRVYWIQKELAEKWAIQAPHGTYVSFLNETHAMEVDEIWPHRYDGSLSLISAMVRVNFGVGLFDSETNELMAWALHWFYGAIGVLQTKDQHKKKGYGATVVRAISKEIARRGDDVFLNILADNTPSINLVKKLGFKMLMNGTWIFKGY